jgi:uncharacterized protein (DUF58 family)
MVVCLLLVSAISALLFRGSFAARRRLPSLASAGHPFRYSIFLDNISPRRYRDLEVMEELEHIQPDYPEFAARWSARLRGKSFSSSPSSSPVLDFKRVTADWTPVPDLSKQARAHVTATIVPLRRGTLRFRGLLIGRVDPLGLVRGWKRIKQPQSLTVLPRRYHIPALALTGVKQYQPGGVALASSIGESDEFVALRDYRPGDPLRHIHWRTWARIGRPIVKEYQDEFFVRYGLILDTFGRAEEGEVFEEAVSVAASFAATVATQESLLDLLFVGPQAYCFTAGRGVGQIEHILQVLAGVQLCQKHAMEQLRRQVLGHIAQVSSCIMVLLRWDMPRRQLVRDLRALGLPLLVLVLGTSPSQAGLPEARWDEHGASVHWLDVNRVGASLQALGGGSP